MLLPSQLLPCTEAPEKREEKTGAEKANREKRELFNLLAVCEWGTAITSIHFTDGETETQMA